MEAVLPDAYGVTESCCFCLRRGKRQFTDDDFDANDANDFVDPGSTINNDDEENGALLATTNDH